MLTELIAAERLTYGPYRFRLEVRHRILGVPFRRVYSAKVALLGGGRTWFRDSGKQAQERVHRDLETLLDRALACNQCPPQRILACYYA
jgi:hypothetical protein